MQVRLMIKELPISQHFLRDLQVLYAFADLKVQKVKRSWSTIVQLCRTFRVHAFEGTLRKDRDCSAEKETLFTDVCTCPVKFVVFRADFDDIFSEFHEFRRSNLDEWCASGKSKTVLSWQHGLLPLTLRP